jgi:hypothetical protein
MGMMIVAGRCSRLVQQQQMLLRLDDNKRLSPKPRLLRCLAKFSRCLAEWLNAFSYPCYCVLVSELLLSSIPLNFDRSII